jgi:glycosyltransferase involved in cell wall biosynthesis
MDDLHNTLRILKEMPTVSVIIPSYNHEKFIKECIESVLEQSFQDFEIIITDDGSADNTVREIKAFSDPRIKLFVHPENRGACIAANNCLEHASGKYIAVLSSDDIWYPEKLELQVDFLEKHPDIAGVFGKADWIDEKNQLITDKDFPYKEIFNVNNRSRFEWLRYFFKKGNCLCHPCSLIRRECYDEIGMFDPSMASLPDLDLWVRLCFKYQIYIMDRKLIRFRVLKNAENASGNNLSNYRRIKFEYKQILNHYLAIQDPDELLLIFPEAAKFGKISKDTIPYFLGRIAIDTELEFKVLWGLETIYDLLKDKKAAEELEKSSAFRYLDFIKLAGESDPFHVSPVKDTPKSPARIEATEPVIIVRKSRHFLISSKSLLKSFLSSARSFLGAAGRYGKDLYSIALGSNPEKSIPKLPEPTDKIKFSIDDLEPISDNLYFYRLAGWLSLEELYGFQYERWLVLESSTRTFFYPIPARKNTDPKEALKAPDKEWFSVVLSRPIIPPDIYSLGILFKRPADDTARYTTITNESLVHTAGRLHLEYTDLISKPQTSKVKSFSMAVRTHLKDIFSSGPKNY